MPSLSTIVTPTNSMLSGREGRPPRTETPSSRKRRAAAAVALSYSSPSRRHASSAVNNANESISSATSSIGCASAASVSVSDQSSVQLRPAVSFIQGNMNVFTSGGGGRGSGGAFAFDEDLDHFVQYIDEDEEEEDDDDDDEQEQQHDNSNNYQTQRDQGIIKARQISFESDEEQYRQSKGRGIRGLFRSFEKRRKKRNAKNTNKAEPNSNYSKQPPPNNHQSQQLPKPGLPFRSQSLPILQPRSSLKEQHIQQHSSRTLPDPRHLQHASHPSTRYMNRNNTNSTQRPSVVVDEPSPLVSIPSGEIRCPAKLSDSERSKSVPEYRTYNEPPKSTLPRLGSFDLDIDTIPASPRMATISPFTQESGDGDDEDLENPTAATHAAEDRIVPRYPSWKTSSTTSVILEGNSYHSTTNNSGNNLDLLSTAVVPYATGGGEIEVLDQESARACGNLTMTPFSHHNTLDRQASWNRRLGRREIYHRRYIPSRSEIEELQELEDYLGIFSSTTKHRFSSLWRQLVPPLETIMERANQRQSMQRQSSSSSMSTISSVTNRPPNNASGGAAGADGNANNAAFYSIVLKRGPIQFEQYQDYFSEWILLTRGFVVARPNFQFIPRFQAGDLWTSVVQVQPANPLSITLSCTSRTTSSHLTLTQLKQQQQYGCYTYELSCETPQEQASWLEALRRVVIQAHDSAGTNEKEMGGLGWQYRVVYVPFYTEAVTGNPIQKEKILAGSTGHVDLNALDSYNSYAPLHYATRANHVRVMRFLLEAGAAVNVGDGYGRTPMYYAELHQLPESTIQLLEANGAQRTKEPPTKRPGRGSSEPLSWRLKCFVAAMVLLLMACVASALLWKFGMLESLGIGGGDDNDSERPDMFMDETDSPSSIIIHENLGESVPTPDLPLPFIPEDWNKGKNTPTISPSPTPAPVVVVKTPPPTIFSVGTNTPTSAIMNAVFDTDLFRLLEAASFDAGAALRVDGSPQQRAYFWLLQNANLNSYTSSKKIQRYAMATFYYSTNGDAWADNLHWLSDEDECMWFNKQVATGYETCAAVNRNDMRRVLSSLDLSFNNLMGTIPPEFGLLSGLLRVDLDGSTSGFLSGPLPSELGRLNKIESFSARGNQLSGYLPSELGNWQQVRGIDLSFNKFTGPLADSFASMTWLTELTIGMNELTGELATELGLLTNLFKLSLGSNYIEGPVPSEIGLLTKLRYLDLEKNKLTVLPTEIGRLESLVELSLFENNLAGPIPSEIGGLTMLGSLLLNINMFTGVLPSELGNLSKLQNVLDLSFNAIEGPIPSELGRTTLLRSLFLQSNKLNGALPNEISHLSNLNTLRVESNDIVGVVPTDLCTIFNTTFAHFYADCGEKIACACCTYCCTDGGCSCQYAGTDEAYLC